MKKYSILSLLFAAFLTLPACDTLQQVAGEVLAEPTIEEIGRGLKEALSQGASKGADALSKRDAYFKNAAYKILLPPDAQKVATRLRAIPGFSNFENDLIERINHAAEDAAKDAGSIFLASIRQMTFQDARRILLGPDNAATDYLKRTTTKALYDKFNPHMTRALDRFGVNDLWTKGATAYNALPGVSDVSADLDDYITNRALDGLFLKIQDEEKNIRNNPVARTTELMRKVFAKQDRK